MARKIAISEREVKRILGNGCCSGCTPVGSVLAKVELKPYFWKTISPKESGSQKPVSISLGDQR